MTRLARVVGSLVFFALDSIGETGRRLVGRPSPGACVVLYYHAVPDEKRAAFARQMDQLQRTAMPVRAGVSAPLEPGRRYAVVTFDDGFASVWENAYPELAAREIPATVFIPSGVLGEVPNWGDLGLMGGHDDGDPVISRSELATRAGNDLLDIGSHSVSHPRIDRLPDAEARAELVDSKRTLEEIIGRPVTLFSYPHGQASERDIALAREAGYERVFSTLPVNALRSSDEFVSGRVIAGLHDWPIETWLKLNGAYRWLPLAFRLKAHLRAGHEA